MTRTVPRPNHPVSRPRPRPDDAPSPADEPVSSLEDVAARAAHLAQELTLVLAQLADAAEGDPWVRQARYRLVDASECCRRAGEELRDLAALRAGRQRVG